MERTDRVHQGYNQGAIAGSLKKSRGVLTDRGNPQGAIVTFSHGWPLSSDNWENQMVHLADHGYRVIAHDRRGRGRSTQTWNGNNTDTFHGTGRFKKAVLVGAVPPLMVKTSANSKGTDNGPFFGFNRPGAQKSEGQIRSWWQQGINTSFKSAYDSIRDFSESDFTEDLKRINIPTLVLHGDDDQVVPIEAAGLKSAKLLPQGKLKIYKGVNQDLLDFIHS
ncbi:Alpha/Beta hydrolase protein [Aspergillus insuetus]